MSVAVAPWRSAISVYARPHSARTLLDLFTQPELLTQAKTQFEQDTKETPYFSFLPADAKPPLELNREMMERFRPEMRKHYLNKTPRFN